MKKQIFTAFTAVLLGASAWMPTAQAANFTSIQPYITDYKFGFTNGTKLVTQPVYDEFTIHTAWTVVTKAGKKGILDNKTGKEITPAIWDQIEVPSPGKIAIVQKGGWFQYLDLGTGKLSATKFAGGHTYYFSPAHEMVILMVGQTSMLLDSSGKVLIPPTAGKLSVVQLADTSQPNKDETKTTRYVLRSASKQITLYDPVTFTPKFTLKNAEWIPNEGGPDTAYLKVRSGGKEGLVDVSGKYALAPQYNALYFWNNGYVRVEGPKGVGLWKDGKMMAEPQYADVGIPSTDTFSTMAKDSITYHSVSKGASVTLKKGAELLDGRYVLGQDVKTGLYGVVELGGEAVIPFVYPRVEGPPAARLLVRADGKKGLIPSWEQKMAEPTVWFDSLTTLGGSYSMLAIQDGKKIGLYSETRGILLEPEENTVITYDQKTGRVIVKSADGKTTAYGFDGNVIHDTAEMERALTDHLAVTGNPETGYVLIDRETKGPISKTYRSIYMEGDGKNLIVALDGKVADLYSPDGELLTKEIQVPLVEPSSNQPPLSFATVGGVVYTAGVKADSDKWALISIKDGQLQPVSEFAYVNVTPRNTSKSYFFTLGRPDGTSDVWGGVNGEMKQQVERATSVQTVESMDRVFIQKGTGWDVYSPDGQMQSNGSYGSLKYLDAGDGKPGAIAYQDGKSGMWGLLSIDGKQLTEAKFDNLYPTRQVFPQLWLETSSQASFVFMTKQRLGYLDQNGQETFQTALLTKKPTITNRPLASTQTLVSYSDILRQDPLELVAFDKPYSWPEGVSSEKRFFANLALHLNLPKEAGKEEVLEELIGKGIIKQDDSRTDLSDEDMFALCYYMETGQISQMTYASLLEWAYKRGLVIQRGGHNYYQSMDLYHEYHQMFFREMLRTPAGKKAAQPKKLSLATLSTAQKNMLESMILVNGKAWDQLPLPLPKEEWTGAMNALIDQYNKQAPQMLANYLKQQQQ
ncbi:WG repeat-containing protein [Brevibacillus choshinensis]|uniref:WG repeat-containing protein n=1 Tax=Brevibacillus choshinensis TaxID=54911 RepID=A0ABX7FLE3_BRECH|nr:WG repeat-containing protein [Brevibacillus choshinensis]QRG66563.1 WG repeat-containing protein [Brevibacillus choshinensis]